jgi:hypothetical protein
LDFAMSHPETTEQENASSHEWEMRGVAPRFKVRLGVPVLVLVTPSRNSPDEQFLALQGEVSDVSESGLALTVSAGGMKELLSFGLDCTMQMVLPLPNGAVELQAAPARYQKLRGDEGNGVMVGAYITDMSGRERARYMEFIGQLSSCVGSG